MEPIGEIFAELDRMQKTCTEEEIEEWLVLKCRQSEQEEPADPLIISSLYNELGSFYRHRNKPEKGAEAFLKAKVAAQPFQDANYATIINNLAGDYRMMGNYDEAIALFQEAIDLYQKFPETPKSLVSSGYNNLALVYMDMKQYGKAAELLQSAAECLAQAEGCYFEKATNYANMAVALYNNKEKDLAIEKVRMADELYKSGGLETIPEYAAFLKLKEIIEGA